MMRHLKDLKLLLLLSIVALTLTVACGGGGNEESEEYGNEPETPATEPAPSMMKSAVAEIHGQEGSNITGTVTFSQAAPGEPVTIQAEVSGLDGAGMHGFHIHAVGDCSAPDFTSAGGHFNPENVDHACPPTTPRHAGDLGNIEVGEDGHGILDQSSDLITLEDGAMTSIIGKAVILHAGEELSLIHI